MKISKKPKKVEPPGGYMGFKWYFNETTNKTVRVEVIVKKVGKNTYYFQGKRQLTQKLHSTEKEAVEAHLDDLDKKISAYAHILAEFTDKRAVIREQFAKALKS